MDAAESAGRPYVLLSCAMSLDGYLDDATSTRLVLSGPEDLDRVDELRAGSDAILVGAGTIRADNPRLRVRSRVMREGRIARGLPPDPLRVTITGTGNLDPNARCFARGAGAGESGCSIVFVASSAFAKARSRLGEVAEIVDAGEPADLLGVLADLRQRGIERLMVEGGASILTQFLTSGLADELQLAVAPFFVGDVRAPRLAGDGAYPWAPARPATLVQVSKTGEDAVLTYALSSRYP